MMPESISETRRHPSQPESGGFRFLIHSRCYDDAFAETLTLTVDSHKDNFFFLRKVFDTNQILNNVKYCCDCLCVLFMGLKRCGRPKKVGIYMFC